ncbi:hypothetical protein PSTT_00522 [Puccinia striiformis]|uniref:CCHC-type domain-containing protein n=1 Tax=Puccinia striiformis TaxID=27350 RepID=A0A2S4W799_9BASI|nr:hypothetical protein PSTT_00522 [Puccinia striiformis]
MNKTKVRWRRTHLKDCSNPTTPKSRYNCGDSGHIEKRLFSIPQGQCFKCLFISLSVDCTSSVGAKQAQQLYSGGRSGRGFSARNCYTCGGVGHLSRDCLVIKSASIVVRSVMLAEIARVLKLRIVTPAVNQDTSVRIGRSMV